MNIEQLRGKTRLHKRRHLESGRGPFWKDERDFRNISEKSNRRLNVEVVLETESKKERTTQQKRMKHNLRNVNGWQKKTIIKD